MAPATKRLNLSVPSVTASKSKTKAVVAASHTTSSSSDEEEVEEERTASEPEQDESDDESDEEFEIPPGFETVKGSTAITRDAVLSDDKELWFFKLPKNMDASALANVSFKLGKHDGLGEAVATVARENKSYRLQNEHATLTQQLVNAFPQAADRTKFTLAKPFTRVFSLVEDRRVTDDATATETKATKHSKRDAAEAIADAIASPVKKSKKHKSSKHATTLDDAAATTTKPSKKHKSSHK